MCQQCSEQEYCNYYPKVIETIKEFIDTPLNIHFANCKNYQSALLKTMKDIENNAFIPEYNEEVMKVILKDLYSILTSETKKYFSDKYIKIDQENIDELIIKILSTTTVFLGE